MLRKDISEEAVDLVIKNEYIAGALRAAYACKVLEFKNEKNRCEFEGTNLEAEYLDLEKYYSGLWKKLDYFFSSKGIDISRLIKIGYV